MPGIAKQSFSNPTDLIPEELFWPEIVSRFSFAGDPRGGPQNHRILKTIMFITLFVIFDEKRKTAESGAKTLGKQAPFARAATKIPRAKKPLFHWCFWLEHKAF